MNDMHKPDDFHDEQLSGLYRQSRIEEPPMALDSAILQRARQAVETKRRWWPWLRRFWIAPLATAAVALLTVSVVIQMRQQHPEALAPAPALQQEAPTKRQNEALTEESAAKKQRALEKREIAPATPVPSSAGQASPPLRRQAPAPSEAENKAQPQTGLKAAKPAPASAPNMQSFGSRQKAAADRVAEPAAPLPAKAWLRQIQELLKAGKREEAKTELTKFIKQYPAHSLPQELQTLRKELPTTSK